LKTTLGKQARLLQPEHLWRQKGPLAQAKSRLSASRVMHRWFSKHSPIFKRILLLKEIDDEMNSGKYSNSRVYSHI
jgi:hypothetical protein